MTTDLRFLEGKPWTDFIGYVTPENHGSVKVDNTNARSKLNIADMGIYGIYPGVEPLILARCDYCGDKFKLAAIAEHMVLKHPDGKKTQPIENTTADVDVKKFPQKNSRVKDRSEINSSPFPKGKKKTSSTAASPSKKNSPDIYVPLPPANVDSNIKNSSAHKQDRSNQLKVKKSKEDKNSISNSKSISGKVHVNGVSTSNNNNNNLILRKDKKTDSPKKPNSKRIPNHVDKKYEENGPKVNNESSKKDEIKYSVSSSNENQNDPLEAVLKRKIIEKKKLSVKVRTFNPDRHCGVVAKENAKSCTKSLECKSHSVFLKRIVDGRSKPFDVLLAEYRAEKESIKQKVQIETEVDVKKPFITESSSEHSLQPPAPKLQLNVCPSLFKPDSVVEEFSVSVNQQITPNLIRSDDNHIRLSLPVSINNPSLVSGLKSSLMKVDLVTNEKPRSNGVNLSNGLSKEIMRNLTRRLTQIPQPSKTVLRRTIPKKRKKKTPSPKKSKVGCYTQWNPWYRRAGGLLITSANVSCHPTSKKIIKDKSNLLTSGENFKKTPRNFDRKINCINLHHSTNSKIVSLDDLKEVYFKLLPDSKFSAPFKIKNKHLLGITFPSFSNSFMIKVQQSSDPQFLHQKKFNDCQESDSSSDSEKSDGDLPEEVTDYRFKLLEPIRQPTNFLKINVSGTPLAACKHRNHLTSSNLDDKNFNLGIGTLFSGKKVCLETVQRLHFVTPSGPMSVSLKQADTPELSKDFRTQSLDGIELIQPNLTGFTFPLDADDLANEIYMVS